MAEYRRVAIGPVAEDAGEATPATHGAGRGRHPRGKYCLRPLGPSAQLRSSLDRICRKPIHPKTILVEHWKRRSSFHFWSSFLHIFPYFSTSEGPHLSIQDFTLRTEVETILSNITRHKAHSRESDFADANSRDASCRGRVAC